MSQGHSNGIYIYMYIYIYSLEEALKANFKAQNSLIFKSVNLTNLSKVGEINLVFIFILNKNYVLILMSTALGQWEIL